MIRKIDSVRSIKSLDSFVPWEIMVQIQEFHSAKLLLVLARSRVQISSLSLELPSLRNEA